MSHITLNMTIHEYNAADHAAHGFGDGTGTELEGWPERALAFLEGLQ